MIVCDFSYASSKMIITGTIESIGDKNAALNCLHVFSNAPSVCSSDRTSYRNNRKNIWDFHDKPYVLQYHKR